MENDNVKSKNYYAPMPTFLVFLFYVVLATFILALAFPKNLLTAILIIVFLMAVLVNRVIRLSYYLKIIDGKIYECGLFTLKRTMPINEIQSIFWRKENFWTGGATIIASYLTPFRNLDWQRQFYLKSDKNILPKYPVTAKIIKDIMKIRPDVKIDAKRVTFNSPFKKL